MMLTQARLQQVLQYDKRTGVFYWRVTHGRMVAGVRAGNISHGYWMIGFDYKRHYVHRLAWLYVYGHLPKQLDHKNRKKTDNRIANLREATNGQNQANSKRHSISGFKGVRKHHRKWTASIRYEGQFIYLGLFDTPQAAHAAYCKAAKKLHGKFFNNGRLK
jgi:HNH endonuclease/AP2 domain